MARGRKRGGGGGGDGDGDGDVDGGGGGDYEKLREQRIKENKERMQNLGLLELSQKLKPPKLPRNHPPPSDKDRDKDKTETLVRRRSSRIQTLPSVNYSEKRKGRSSDNDDDASWSEVEIHLQEGTEPEIYTDEHEKLLGDSETSWTLLADGYGDDGKRIHDPVNGETCHQCRQKTLGYHTHCSKCKLVRGQFCGDCLYTRYGENVMEVNQNPNWICPVCRGICNCSLCRQGNGWRPTGAIYRKVKRLGFKSVAHYLIQTRRGQVNPEGSASADAGSPPSSLNEAVDVDEDPEGSQISLV